jgi:hypothetical protein
MLSVNAPGSFNRRFAEAFILTANERSLRIAVIRDFVGNDFQKRFVND